MRHGREVYQVDPRPWSGEKGRPVATAIDPEAVQRLQAEGLSQRAIARWLGIPRSTLQDHLKHTQAVDLRCGGNTLILPQRGPRPPRVSPVPETPAALEGVVADLLEVWQRFAGKWATRPTGQKPFARVF
jgi:hypothetical protein